MASGRPKKRTEGEFCEHRSALTAEIFLSLHKTVGFTSAVRASNSTDRAATRLCAKPHGTRERDHRISVPRAVNTSIVAGPLCFMINHNRPLRYGHEHLVTHPDGYGSRHRSGLCFYSTEQNAAFTDQWVIHLRHSRTGELE